MAYLGLGRLCHEYVGEMILLPGYFPIFKKNSDEKTTKKQPKFFYFFLRRFFVVIKNTLHLGILMRVSSTIHSTDRSPIPQSPGAVVYPGHLNGSVWMSDPCLSLHHPIPHLLIPEFLLPLISGWILRKKLQK
jgi:hypothetical protein